MRQVKVLEKGDLAEAYCLLPHHLQATGGLNPRASTRDWSVRAAVDDILRDSELVDARMYFASPCSYNATGNTRYHGVTVHVDAGFGMNDFTTNSLLLF